MSCPHCGSTNVDPGATGLDLCRDCGGLSRSGRALEPATRAPVGEEDDGCPDDPDGQHHVSCGCPDSDFLE